MLSLLPWLLLLLPLTLDSVTHWVMQDDTLFTKDRSEFDLADSGSLVKLLNQEQLVEEASRILDDMTIVKQHIMNETPPISDEGNECDTQTQCYGSLVDYDFSIVPAILKTVDGYSRFQQFMCESDIPWQVPNCTAHKPPPVNMASYHHIPGINYIVEEKGPPSYNLLSFIPTDNLALFGHCLNKNLHMNGSNWHVYYAATFYWRLQGNHVAARDCVLKSLYYANNERGIVDGPLVALANLLSSAGLDGDAARVMQHSALNPSSVQLKLWSAGNLYTLSGQYKLALEMYNATLQLGPFPLADERLQTMQCYNKVILRMEKQNNLLRSTLKRLQEHHVLESRYIGVQEQLVRRLRNPVLPQHIINQIKSTEEAVFNTQQLVNDQKNIQASLNPFSSVSSLKSPDELELEVTVSEEEFKESQQSQLEYIEVTSDKPTSLQWMRAARIRLEEVTSTIGEQLDHHPDNLHIHMFDDPEDIISVKATVVKPRSALEPSVSTLPSPTLEQATLEHATLEQATLEQATLEQAPLEQPKTVTETIVTKPVEAKPIVTKPVASPVCEVKKKLEEHNKQTKDAAKLEEHNKQTKYAAKPKKAAPNGICTADEGTGEGCMVSVNDNSINTCGIGVATSTKEVEKVKAENGSTQKKAKQPTPEGELMFELYEDKAEWDSLQGEALLIEDESIVVEPTEWKTSKEPGHRRMEESSLKNPTVEEILKEPDVIEKMRVMRNDYMKSGVMKSSVKEGREDEKDVPVFPTVNNCKGCPKDKQGVPPTKIKIKLTYDDDYTLLLTQVPMDQAVDILKIEKCAEYVPIFTLQEPYFPLMIPLITFGIHVEDVLKLKTMPVQLPLSTPNCTARMELGVCETCYDYLLFGKDRVLFGDRKLQEHFAFQEINQPHIAKNVEYLGAMLAHRLKQEPDNWMLYHLSALYHRSTATTIGPALECTRRALALAPLQYRTVPLITLVNVLHQAQRYPDAMTVLIELVQLDPTQFIIHIEASMLHAAISEPNAALYFGMEAVRLEPYSPLTNQLFNSLLCYFKIDEKMSRARSGNTDDETPNVLKKKKDAPLPGHKQSTNRQQDLSAIEVWKVEHFEGGDVNMTWVDEPNPI